MARLAAVIRESYLSIFLPIAVVVAVTGAIIAEISYRNAYDAVLSGDQEAVRRAEREISTELTAASRHIRSLPHEADMVAGIDDPTPDSLVHLTIGLTTLLQRNRNYELVRWIDQTGMERVRVDQGDDPAPPRVADASALGNKSDRPYFRTTATLPNGMIYVAGLERDEGRPGPAETKRQILRLATPVIDQAGDRRGIVTIDVPMIPVFTRLVTHVGNHVTLLDRYGSYLFGPQVDGPRDRNGNATSEVQNQLSVQVRADLAGQTLNEFGLWTWTTITAFDLGYRKGPGDGEALWTAIVHRSPQFLDQLWIKPWTIAGIIAAILIMIALGFTHLAAGWSRTEFTAVQESARAAAIEAGQRQIIADLEKNQNRLATLAAIVSSSDDAIIGKTLAGVITSWNHGAEKVFGYTADEAIGQKMLMLFPPDRVGEEAIILDRISRGECVKHFVTKRRRKDGVLIDVSATISPIYDESGRVVGASKVARDVTEQTRDADELKRHREHLQDLVKQQTQELRTAHARLTEQRDLLTTVTDKLPNMVSYWDASQRCIFVNPAYQNWIGKPLEELIGKSVEDVLGTAVYQKLKDKIDASHRGETQYYEAKLKDASGKDIYCQVHFIPDMSDGKVLGVFVLISDVTAIKLAELRLRDTNERLADALKEAKAADEAKGQFLSNMSHEIRTPMNSVLGFLGLALESDLPAGLRRQLTTAHNAAKSLLMLINDILDLSKLQSGKIQFEQVPFNLRSLIDSVTEMFSVKAVEKKLDLRVDYSSEVETRFLGDPTRIRQVITNLLSNAIKFTDAGVVTIAVKPAAGLAGVVVAVTDTGIGMTEDQMSRIFSPFVQADSSTTRRFGGTGLGVSICKQIADGMGGEISVSSVVDQGTTFQVTLTLKPLPPNVDCPDADMVGSNSFRSPRRFRVLLADDIEENVELGVARLKSQGHEVDIARTGREAADLALSGDYDVILMDIHMPVMNGLDATREIRHARGNAAYQVPIIALTASVLAMERAQCLSAGMTAFVGKPIDFAELFATMEAQVPIGRGKIVPAGFSLGVTDVGAPIMAGLGVDIVNFEDGRQRWGNISQYVHALSRFSVKYAGAPGQMRVHYDRGDWDAAYELAHAFKGVASNLSLVEVARISAVLNDLFKGKSHENTAQVLDELDAACGRAVLTIAEIVQGSGDHHLAPVEPDDGSAKLAANPDALAALRRALDNDDPGAVERVLESWASTLPADLVSRLRASLEEFEFEEARRLIDDYGRQIAA